MTTSVVRETLNRELLTAPEGRPQAGVVAKHAASRPGHTGGC
jgi:hypothetical protein